jgi:hypothetical protein
MEKAERLETVVVGGAQARLAIGHPREGAEAPFVILEAHGRIGDS